MKRRQLEKLDVALHKNREETQRFCEKHKRVFLYGAGRTATQLIRYLKLEAIDINSIIVSNGEKRFETLQEIPVVELKDYVYEDGDGFIIAIAEIRQRKIVENLKEYLGEKICGHIYCQRVFSAGETTSEEDWYAGTIKESTYFKDFEELERIGKECGTDKSELCHNYLRRYEFFLSKWRHENIVLMELGVFRGQSLKMWEQFFDKANIIGVDIDDNCKRYKNERTDIVIMDLSDIDNLINLGKYKPTVIIDDASHEWRDQILSLATLFPMLKKGGVFIMEDIGTSFSKHIRSSENNASIRGYDFLSLLCEATTGNIKHIREIDDSIKGVVEELSSEIDMITFLYGSCIIVKR